LQSDGHPSRTEGYRKAKLCSNQFEDDTVRILKPPNPCACADRKPADTALYVPAMSAAVRKLEAVPGAL